MTCEIYPDGVTPLNTLKDLANIENFYYAGHYFSLMPKENQDLVLEDIKALSSQDLRETQRILQGYFSLLVPNSLIIQVLLKDINLACEVQSGSISDTMSRDLLIDAVMREMRVMNPGSTEGEDTDFLHWPCMGNNQEYRDKFNEILAERMPIYGVIMLD